jgi:uncharacterized protein
VGHREVALSDAGHLLGRPVAADVAGTVERVNESVQSAAEDAVDPEDAAAVEAQLGRAPRGLRAVAHRCPCGRPDVVETAPRIKTERNPDGEPFPTLYYLTCPKAASAIGTLEGGGLMAEMTERLRTDPELAARYRLAHEDYLRRRDAIEILPGFPSAGGMPDRVKCLHVLVAHSLAAGPGVNPLGDEALALLPEWWRTGSCVPATELSAAAEAADAPTST